MSTSASCAEIAAAIKERFKGVVFGQDEVIHEVLIALLAGGHVLVEGVPGIAKTLVARVLARLFDCEFRRVQFTPDLMPTDLIGVQIYDERERAFEFRPGPIFANFLLCDEINRCPAKTQSALLEAMEECQVTVDGRTHPLPEPFLVIATQNPLEEEGVYPLPRAQLDRFMMKVEVDYPDIAGEVALLGAHYQRESRDLSRFQLEPVVAMQQLIDLRSELLEMKVREELLDYVARLVRATRTHVHVEAGASPRAGLMVLKAAKVEAALAGRDHLLPDDVKAVLVPCLRHRLALTPAAELDGIRADQVLASILSGEEIPR